MENWITQFICGNEVNLLLKNVNVGELYITEDDEGFNVYEKCDDDDKFITTVASYGELYDIKDIDNDVQSRNFILLNP